MTHQQKAQDKSGFSTVFFVKKEFKYIDEGKISDRLVFSCCDDRVYSIRALGIVIAGVHIPLNRGTGNRARIREDTWEELIDYFKKNSRGSGLQKYTSLSFLWISNLSVQAKLL